MKATPVCVFILYDEYSNERWGENELRHFTLEDDSCYLVGEKAKQTYFSRVQSVKKEVVCRSVNHLFQNYIQNTVLE